MSEDEARRLEAEEHAEDDVEAHRGGKHNTAHDEGKTEGDGDDDFEAHRHGKLNFRPGQKA
jgi:hypothetical protein